MVREKPRIAHPLVVDRKHQLSLQLGGHHGQQPCLVRSVLPGRGL